MMKKILGFVVVFVSLTAITLAEEGVPDEYGEFQSAKSRYLDARGAGSDTLVRYDTNPDKKYVAGTSTQNVKVIKKRSGFTFGQMAKKVKKQNETFSQRKNLRTDTRSGTTFGEMASKIKVKKKSTNSEFLLQMASIQPRTTSFNNLTPNVQVKVGTKEELFQF